MDLTKGGLKDSPPPAAPKSRPTGTESREIASNSRPPHPSTRSQSYESTNDKFGKRTRGDPSVVSRSDVVEDEAALSGKRQKTMVLETTPRTVSTPRSTFSQVPTSHTRSTNAENDATTPRTLPARPTSRARSIGLIKFCAATPAATNSFAHSGTEGTSDGKQGASLRGAGDGSEPSATRAPNVLDRDSPTSDQGIEYVEGEDEGEEDEKRDWEQGRFSHEGNERFQRFANDSANQPSYLQPEDGDDPAQFPSSPRSEESESNQGEKTAEVDQERFFERDHGSPESKPTETTRDLDRLNPIPSLFPGPHPFLDHARALLSAKKVSSEEVPCETTESEIIERLKRESVGFAEHFQNILTQTQDLFEGSLARQSEVVAKLERHSDELAKEDSAIKETKNRLMSWSTQLLEGGEDSNR